MVFMICEYLIIFVLEIPLFPFLPTSVFLVRSFVKATLIASKVRE